MRTEMMSVKALVETILRTGFGYLNSMTENNQLDIVRFDDMESVRCRWLRTCVVLSHAETLEERCNALVDCSILKEDDLVEVEVAPIDIRAKLSRADLEARSGNRGGPGRRRLHKIGMGSKSRDPSAPNSVTASPSGGVSSDVGLHSSTSDESWTYRHQGDIDTEYRQ